jgi:hypothetical protein
MRGAAFALSLFGACRNGKDRVAPPFRSISLLHGTLKAAVDANRGQWPIRGGFLPDRFLAAELGKRLFTWRLSATRWKPRLWEAGSEQLFKRYVRGRPVRLWERIPGRWAESLDCVVYGMAVHNLVTANLDRREEEVASATMPTKGSVVVRSAWLNR